MISDEESRKRLRLDMESAIRNGMWFHDDAGKARRSPRFREILNVRFDMKADPDDEELLYRGMLSIREFSPDLSEEDFLAARRVITVYSYGVRDAWRKYNPNRPAEPAFDREARVVELRKQWVSGLRPGQNQDMLTLLFERQIQNAREIIGRGNNFMPELLMYKGRNLVASLVPPPDPMTTAITMIRDNQPEGYSFAAEAWRAPLTKDYKKWGDLEKSESKVESFLQICAENGGPYLYRTFAIDRVGKVLVRDAHTGQSRMPRSWWLGSQKPPKADRTPSGPYA